MKNNMNQFESALEILKNKKKEINFWDILKDCFKDSFNVWKNGFKNYRKKKESINFQIHFLSKIHKSVKSKKTKEVFESFLKKSYKNFIYSLDYYYVESPSDETKNMIESDKYKELVQYFEKEETFDIYKKICQKTGYFDFYELLNINDNKTFDSEKQNIFIKNISTFIGLINLHLPKNLTEDDIMEDFLSRVDIELLDNK